MSKRLKQTPASLYFVKEELPAWCFNRVVMNFGAEVEADLETITDKNAKSQERKRTARLEKWLGIVPQFRDPAAR